MAPVSLYRIRNTRTGLYFLAGSYGGTFAPHGKVYARRKDADAAVRGLLRDVARLGDAAHAGLHAGDGLAVEVVRIERERDEGEVVVVPPSRRCSCQ